MDKCINYLGGPPVSSSLDAHSGYCHIRVEETYKEKHFTSHSVLYPFIPMPLGLKIGVPNVHRVKVIILSFIKMQFSLVNLENKAIFSRTPWQHIYHTEPVVNLCKESDLTTRLTKCSIFMNSIKYFGHGIRPGRLEFANCFSDAIHELRSPTSQTKVSSIIAFCNFFPIFFQMFSRITFVCRPKLRKR